jgi:hypothetical protein
VATGNRRPAFGRWVLLGAAVADLALLKAGWIAHSSGILAVLFALAILAFGLRWLVLAREVLSEPGRPSEWAALAGATGILLALGGGTANWALGLQGFAILAEQESVPLYGGAALQEFESGPMARIEEMDLHLALDELELTPSGKETFHPTSLLRVWAADDEPTALRVTPNTRARFGSLWFLQGAFGFAPRIVILHGEDASRTVFDRVVPFTTQRHGPTGLSFSGAFNIASEDLAVEGWVDLQSLDEAMRGHAILELTVARQNELLGSGRLLPGHFAELDDGYRVGFAGLEKWSEIVISRRNYGSFVLAGTLLASVGGLLWLVFRRGRK